MEHLSKCKDFCEFAQGIAREAGEELRQSFMGSEKVQVTRKGINPQTLADIASNYAIQREIRRCFPSHDIKSEETNNKPAFDWNYKSDYIWIIDPCDGTVNFMTDIPFFSISIALAYKLEVILGVVFEPIRNEMFSAEKTKGAMLNGVHISAGKKGKLRNSTLGIDIFHDPSLIKQEIRILRILASKMRAVRSFYSGALELCYLATGRIDVRIDDSYRPWDVAAGSIIASEAGARVTDIKNRKWSLTAKTILAANPILHELVMDLISKPR